MPFCSLFVALAWISCAAAFAPPPTFASRQTALKMSSSSDLPKLDPSETALVFIEYQNEFTTEGGKLHDAVKDCMTRTNMLENSARLLQAGRSSGVTIIHCPISFEPGHHEISKSPYGILQGVKEGAAFTAGDWGAQICDAMKPVPGDLIVKGKSGLCGFMSTNLDFLLSQNGIKNVVLGGFLTNCCVESTMRTAYEKGYKVYTLKDCVAATSVAAQDATLEHNFGMFSVPTTSAEIISAVGAPTYA
jgi:nicotinamidase-related amidase